jgi:hypothetical protein
MGTPAKPIELSSPLQCSPTGWHFIEVPAETAERVRVGRSWRVVCTLNGTHTFQCALNPNGKGGFAIGVSKPIREKLGVHEGSTMDVTLARDTSRYGLPMPAELEEVIRQEEDGDRLFHALSPGNQRLAIQIVDAVKDVDMRIYRALVIIRQLRDGHGKFDYDAIHDAIRRRG